MKLGWMSLDCILGSYIFLGTFLSCLFGKCERVGRRRDCFEAVVYVWILVEEGDWILNGFVIGLGFFEVGLFWLNNILEILRRRDFLR